MYLSAVLRVACQSMILVFLATACTASSGHLRAAPIPMRTPPIQAATSTREQAATCPLDRGLEPATQVASAPPIALPVGVTAYGARLFGTSFDLPKTYLLVPPTWQCATLQAGTGQTITAGPALPPYPTIPSTYLKAVANYDGAGGDFSIACDWFRWAAPGSKTFSTTDCAPPGLPTATSVHPIVTRSTVPLMALIVTPPKTHEPEELMSTGPNTRYDFGVMARSSDGSYLQGLTCELPPSMTVLCLDNLRLFLQTSELTRRVPGAEDDKIVAQVASVLRLTS